MKGKVGFHQVDKPIDMETLTHVWKTHIPSLSFVKYKVVDFYEHLNSKSFSIVTETLDGKVGPRVVCEFTKGIFVTKNNMHFSELMAYKRLARHVPAIIDMDNSFEVLDVEEVNENIEKIKSKYPELLI